MNAFEQRHRNDEEGLEWIGRFGWLRTAELGKLIWPNDKFARTRADRVASSWLQRKLVIARPLPNGAGRAFVLSNAGVKLLQDNDIDAQSGKDIGYTNSGEWQPPSGWRHDLIASGILACLYEQNYDIQPERELRRQNPNLTKIPDGLAWRDQSVLWIEVENARKTGPAMKALADAICVISSGQCKPVSGKRPTEAIIGFALFTKDERGHSLNHQTRIVRAVEKIARRDVRLRWAICKMAGSGIASIDFVPKTIDSLLCSRILERLNSAGWQAQEKSSCLISQYGEHKAEIWKDDVMGWSFAVDDHQIELADSQLEAQRGCANYLAGLARHQL